ncbi:MAG: hypothetical protein ACRELB_05145, partial [Polyangiaceae bacterium]
GWGRGSFAAGMLGLALAAVACGGSGVDARYPAHEDGCPVKMYPGAAGIPVDDLGVVQVECPPEGRGACERRLENEVCRRGGDVVWGTADNALNSATMTGHAAHSHRATQGPREAGCPVQVYRTALPMPNENVGPVSALCGMDDPPEVCLRVLQDQACLLGADLLWQIDGPTPVNTSNGPKQRMHGRAAHTK